MSKFLDVVQKERKPNVKTLRDDIKARKNKEFFWATGTQIYVGEQGSGKTISAVRHLYRIQNKHPKALIVSNLTLNHMKPIREFTDEFLAKCNVEGGFNTKKYYIQFSDVDELAQVLTTCNNGIYGVVYLIDEIHTYFNALDSKNIPMFVFTEISQQRKQRKLIIGTSQLFLRMAKPLREQCQNIIVCKTRAGVFTKQVAYDGMTLDQDREGHLVGTIRKKGYFFHTRKIRELFDTMQKVVSAKEQYEELAPFEKKKKLLSRKG
jgi:type II secretory pathway predicted ATPase ExeA